MQHNHDPLPPDVLKYVADAYEALLELSDRDEANVELCKIILFALAELDIHAGTDDRATAPYNVLDEYFNYMLDERTAKPESMEYLRTQRAKFRLQVTEFIRLHGTGALDLLSQGWCPLLR